MPWPYPPRKRNSKKNWSLSKGNWQTNRRSYRLPTDSFPTSKRIWMPFRNARNSREEAYEYTRDVHSKVDSLFKDAMLENMVDEWRELSARMKPERQLFDGTLVRSVAEQGTEVMHCATLLFLGMVDDATTFAETRGGGGGGSDLKWGRDDDEDNRAWALRCMRMASRMMRPAIGKSPNDKWQRLPEN